jgi:hypothetical protein
MDRLPTELQRLFLSRGPGGDRVRGPVLELLRPLGWETIARVWEGVQVDLGLPAPAIAVSGTDACQLWFSLTEAVVVSEAQAFLEGLRARYLADVTPERLRLAPQGVSPLPPAAVAPERWSAFVAPDLAPLFVDEPWLDQPPGADAQAELLSRVQPATPEAFARALAKLVPAAAAPGTGRPATGDRADPRQFLLSVMQDASVDLRLRIEAAKALLQAGGG